MNQIDLKNRVAVVTGGVRGIGFAICQRLRASGASVCIWDRDAEALPEAAQQLLSESGEGKVETEVVELTDSDSVGNATRSTIEKFGGRIDILVNNAGIAGLTKPTWEIPPDEWRKVVEIDLVGPYLTCHHVVPSMIENGFGRIVNIASIAGKEGNPNASHYSAAKAGVIALTKSLGKEVAEKGVIVNCITPAVIETDILKQITQQHIDYMRSKIPMNRFGKVEEAAALVAWLSSEDCSFSTGAVFDLSGGRGTY